MNPIREAEKNIELLVSMTQGLAALQPEIKRLGSIQKVIDEREARLKAIDDELAQVDRKRAALDAECTAKRNVAEHDAEQIRKGSEAIRVEAMNVLKAAQAKGEDARAEASDILAKAREEASRIVDQGKSLLGALTREADDARKQLEAVNAAIADAEKRRAEIEAVIARVAQASR